MSLFNTADHYGSVSKTLHWLLFFLVTFMLILGFVMGTLSSKPLQANAFFIHKSTGLLIFGLATLRLLWMLCNPLPAFPATMHFAHRFLARLMHITLYLILIAMPTSGILLSQFAGRPPSFFGLWTLQLPLLPDKAKAESLANVHDIVAWVLIVLVALHILAALAHHFVMKDKILRRML